MTKPTAASIEASTKLTGLQRQYIKAVAEEAAKDAVATVRDDLVRLFDMNDQYNQIDLNSRLSHLEGRYREDDKFALTKPKLIDLMKKLGMGE